MIGSTKHKNWLEIARNIQAEADATGIGRRPRTSDQANLDGLTPLGRFDQSITSESIRLASRELFGNGHYTSAVEQAFKCLNNEVKEKSGLSETDGRPLMQKAFSADGPALRLNDLNSISEKDEQNGYRELYAGAMLGIRNPRAHEHTLEDDHQVALELLTLASHLMGKLDAAIPTGNPNRQSRKS